MSEEEIKENLKKEIIGLCETNSSVMTYMECLMRKYEELEQALLDIKEYLTSYESIHTIQFNNENDSDNDLEVNKDFDKKTMNEMTNRYLKVHDKLLNIIDKALGDKE